MSLKNTEEVLLNFIKSNIPQVLVIKGVWGSGKTHFLEKSFLKEHKNDSDLGFKKYSYVSLFGLNNLNDLKLNIFHNSIALKDIGKEVLFSDKIKSKKNWFQNGKKLLDSFDDVPVIKNINIFKAIGNGVQILGLLEPKEYLIVIDDFERINKNIDIDEVLGIISELKEKRKCKIILVMNDEKLPEETLKSYNLFKEKVIDIEIEFKPTAEECACIVFGEKSDDEEKLLRDYCIKLGITNIRIIFKIKHFFNLIKPYLNKKNYYPYLMNNTITSLVFISNSFFGNPNDDENSSIPGINFLLTEDSIGNISLYGEAKKEPDYSVRWRTIFRNYGWNDSDEYDIELYHIIKRGYIIQDDLFKVTDKLNLSFIDGNIKKQYTDLWNNLYKIGFVDNEDFFVKGFLDFYLINSKYLDLNDLNTIVSIFRKIGKNEEGTKIIDYFLDGNKENLDKLNLEDYRNRTHYNLDTEIKSKTIGFYNSRSSIELSLELILNGIIEKGYSHSVADETFLFSVSEDDIFNLLNSTQGDYEKGKLQSEYIEILLKYKKVSNAPEEWKKLTDKTLRALERFNNCKMNESRFESFGYLN